MPPSFGRGARLRRRLAPHLADGETIAATARDAVLRDQWAITDRQLLHVDADGRVRSIALDDLTGEVRQEASGLTVRVRSSRDPSVTLLGAFHGANDLLRRVRSIVEGGSAKPPPTSNGA